jgi:sirohydrochlorin cobaltochelatase
LSAELIEPPLPEEIAAAPAEARAAIDELREGLSQQLSLTTIESESPGWIGVECASEEMAIWLQRAVVVENILARRELEVVFLPVGMSDRAVQERPILVSALVKAAALWRVRAAGPKRG